MTPAPQPPTFAEVCLAVVVVPSLLGMILAYAFDLYLRS